VGTKIEYFITGEVGGEQRESASYNVLQCVCLSVTLLWAAWAVY